MDVIEQEAPILFQMIKNNWGSVFSRYSEDGTHLRTIPGIDVTKVLPRFLVMVREDWLADIDISFGDSTRIPLDDSGVVSFVDHNFTLKEFVSILSRIESKFQVPPIVGRLDIHFGTIFGSFGLPVIEAYEGIRVTPYGVPNTIDVESGEVRPNVLTSQFCELVDFLSELNQAGLINQTFFVPDSRNIGALDVTREMVDQVIVGNAAIIPTLYSSDQWVRHIVDSPLRKGEARFVFLPPPVGDYGQGTVRPRPTVDNRTSMAMASGSTEDQVRAALQVLEYMKLTIDGHWLAQLGTDHAVDSGLADGLERTPDEEIAPHFPFFPYYQLYYMHYVTDGHYGAELLEYLSKREKKRWARMPEFWWTVWNRDMHEFFQEHGASLNTYMWGGFQSLTLSSPSQSCDDFQTGLDDRQDLSEAWDRTHSAGIVADLPWIRLDRETWHTAP